jgi:hypothetical protein
VERKVAIMNAPRKYRVLWVIALILKVLAWVSLGVAIVGALFAVPSLFSAVGRGAPWYEILPFGLMLGAPIFGIVWFVQLFAFGSILSLLIDIEANTSALAKPPQ